MTKVLEQFKADTRLPHPERGGVFCLGDDGLIYLIAGGDQSYWIERLQPIREGMSLQEMVLWEQFVRMGHESPPGPRGGRLSFPSIKKAISALEAGEVEWIPSPHMMAAANRQADYTERSADEYLPTKLRWALAKGKGDAWAYEKAGLSSLQRPWMERPCPLVHLQIREV